MVVVLLQVLCGAGLCEADPHMGYSPVHYHWTPQHLLDKFRMPASNDKQTENLSRWFRLDASFYT